MYAIQSTGSAAAYAASRPALQPTSTADTTASGSASPTVSVASATKSFSGYGDLILSSLSSNASDKAAAPDGDETANGQEVNDGDADDVAAKPPSVSFSDAGTYSLNVFA